ncbi:MAG: Divergent domain protein [Dehalococcoidia bacterium]|nr:Divergent domain protein [Dehalococcoidia bacterium]
MNEKKIDEITEEDLQALIDNSVLEGKTREYKQSLPSDSESDKKEFLADISSFANASGGDLIYGIIEDRNTGIPKTLEGLTVDNVDQEIGKLDNMIRTGIEPRISGIIIKPVKLSNSKTTLIIRVSKSWNSPHRVCFRGHDKFYSRSTNGKYPLDVAELRIAFTLSETITERIRKFREDRISKIFVNETPVPFYNTAKIVLHLIPIISFNPAQIYAISEIASHPEQMAPIYCSGWNNRYNLDGFLTYSGGREEKSHSYIQFFRNGIVEAVEGLLLKPYNDEGKLLIPSIAYEKALLESLPNYLSILKRLNVPLPVFVFLTLLGVKGYSMAVDRSRFFRDEVHTIDRDVLLLPEIVIESYDDIAEDVLRPCFNSIWNACGFPRSLNYDDTGKWRER